MILHFLGRAVVLYGWLLRSVTPFGRTRRFLFWFLLFVVEFLDYGENPVLISSMY